MVTKVNSMSAEEISRWAALINALDIIQKECKKKKINFKRVNLSPVKLKPYIDQMYSEYMLAIQEEMKHRKNNNYNYITKKIPSNDLCNVKESIF